MAAMLIRSSRLSRKACLGAMAAAACAIALLARNVLADDRLLQGFRHPPKDARPLVWWHWTNGNITKAAITADLEAMARVGVGGVQVFDVDVGNPPLVRPAVEYMTPQWLELMAFAASECRRLGMTMSLHSSAGWSESGGPWVEPAEGMRKLVWSELRVRGPARFQGQLPSPPRVWGPFQTLARDKMGTPQSQWPAKVPEDYADERVVAFPSPPGRSFPGVPGTLVSAASGFDARVVTDGDLNTRVKLAFPTRDTPVVVDLTLEQEIVVQAISLATGWTSPLGEVLASADGVAWQKVADMPRPPIGSRPVSKTIAFEPVAAKHLRFVFRPRTAKLSFELAELQVFETPRVHRFEEKAGFALLADVQKEVTPAPASLRGLDPSRVVDLTSSFRAGHGAWQVPAGEWTIMRFGHSATGMKTRPATPAGLGLEVDKLNADAVRRYIRTFLSKLDRGGVLGAGSVSAVLMDSWEAEHQNWSPRFLAEFRARRGYDPVPWLPAMTGVLVYDAERSDRFLWDVRRTIAETLADSHYGVIAKALHERGLRLEAEAVGQGMPMTADQLQARGRVDVPMGEFWVPAPGSPLQPSSDCKEAASAAHAYGKTVVGAEAFSSGADVPAWSQTPRSLKTVGDLHFATGINRLSLHQYTAQPDEDRRPGLTLAEWGSPFNRFNPWWEQSSTWFEYLARAQFLLQQGRFVGDVLYFYGEGAPRTLPKRADIVPSVPEGRDYDFINAEALARLARVNDGALELPGGEGYRVLVLPHDDDRATPDLLRTLLRLVRRGVTVLGPRPTRSPSLEGGARADREVAALAQILWGPCVEGRCVHHVGKGRVATGFGVEELLTLQSHPVDVELTGRDAKAIAFLHRRTADEDVFFLANLTERAQAVEATLRARGDRVELWFPETADIRSAPWAPWAGRTRLSLALRPRESVFVLVRRGARAVVPPSITAAPEPPAVPVSGPWTLSFASAARGAAPAPTSMDQLVSLSEISRPEVRHVSGQVTYRATFTLPAGQAALALDLGLVHDTAAVRLNGKDMGVLWNQTCVPVGGIAVEGQNQLEITVSVGWPNRLIADAALPAAERTTWTTFAAYAPGVALRPSGLLGPVQLRASCASAGW